MINKRACIKCFQACPDPVIVDPDPVEAFIYFYSDSISCPEPFRGGANRYYHKSNPPKSCPYKLEHAVFASLVTQGRLYKKATLSDLFELERFLDYPLEEMLVFRKALGDYCSGKWSSGKRKREPWSVFLTHRDLRETVLLRLINKDAFLNRTFWSSLSLQKYDV